MFSQMPELKGELVGFVMTKPIKFNIVIQFLAM